MRIAIISDIHANIHGLKLVLNDSNKVDKILCAGDITGFYPFVNEVIDELKKNNVVSVKGNHDQYLIDGKAPDDKREEIKRSVEWMKKLITKENYDYIRSLPDYLETLIDNKRILVTHGSPWNHLEERIYPDYSNFNKFKELDFDIIVLGHTHRPFTRKIGDLTVINPGSCGQPRDNNRLSYTLWDTEKDSFENIRLEWDIDKFKNEAMLRGADESLFEVFKRI